MPAHSGATMKSKGDSTMMLKAPGILTFMVSVILVVFVVCAQYFQANIPLVKGHEFWVLLVAHLTLVLGCTIRNL